MKRYEEDFKSKLVGLDFNTIENSPHSIFGLSKELKLIYYNTAWLQFSKTINKRTLSSKTHLVLD